MTAWQGMGPDQFDKRLGTRQERKLAARLREQPDTLLPELAEVQFTPPGKPSPQVTQLDGQDDLFGGQE